MSHDEPVPTEAHADAPMTVAPIDAGGWQALPVRAHGLFVATSAIALAVPALLAAALIGMAMADVWIWLAVTIAAALAGTFGGWLGHKRFVHTLWRLDDDGFAVRHGRLFETETRVPGSRVQHIDVRRGPLQRRYALATLVIHTAGTRHSEVTVSGLAFEDAERLRDTLARQAGDDDC